MWYISTDDFSKLLVRHRQEHKSHYCDAVKVFVDLFSLYSSIRNGPNFKKKQGIPINKMIIYV